MQRPAPLYFTNDDRNNTQGDGMRSYREVVAQDADFADATEAAAWLGFSTRRNPLFLPPKAAANFKNTPSCVEDIHSDLLARLRDAQDFILLEKKTPSFGTSKLPAGGEVVTPTPIELSGSGGGGGGPRRPTIRARVRAMNGHLATSQERIRELEDTLGSLEAGRDSDRERAVRARAAATEAGKQKMTQKMYRLRGNAALLEEGLTELEAEITAVRVRLFAERLVSSEVGFPRGVIQRHRQDHLPGMFCRSRRTSILSFLVYSSMCFCTQQTTTCAPLLVELGWAL